MIKFIIIAFIICIWDKTGFCIDEQIEKIFYLDDKEVKKINKEKEQKKGVKTKKGLTYKDKEKDQEEELPSVDLSKDESSMDFKPSNPSQDVADMNNKDTSSGFELEIKDENDIAMEMLNRVYNGGK